MFVDVSNIILDVRAITGKLNEVSLLMKLTFKKEEINADKPIMHIHTYYHVGAKCCKEA